MDKCYFCGSELFDSQERENLWEYCHCPICGDYEFNMEKLYTKEGIEYRSEKASYLYYHKKELPDPSHRFVIVLGNNPEDKRTRPNTYCPTISEILEFCPKSFSEQVDFFLNYLFSRSKILGDYISFSLNELTSALFLNREDTNHTQLSDGDLQKQIVYILSYLYDNKYCEYKYENSTHFIVRLLPNGLERVDNFGRDPKNSRTIFVAMSFDQSAAQIRDAIKKGIEDAGFESILIDEVIHTHQIVPEILKYIRSSRLVVHEISEANRGAYYEAGYAEGVGKEVITTCNRESFDGLNGADNKPHFDIQQKQLLLWDNCEELSNQLTRWIKALTS